MGQDRTETAPTPVQIFALALCAPLVSAEDRPVRAGRQVRVLGARLEDSGPLLDDVPFGAYGADATSLLRLNVDFNEDVTSLTGS